MTKVLEAVSAIGALVMAATPLVAIGGVAHAQEVQPQVIRVADLDMSRPADVARFDARVGEAAQQMCSGRGDMTINVSCRQAVREEALQKLNALRAQTTASITPASGAWTVAGR